MNLNKTLIVVLLCCFGLAVTAKTTNLMVSELADQPIDDSIQPAIQQNHLIYATQRGEQHNVRAFNTLNNDNLPVLEAVALGQTGFYGLGEFNYFVADAGAGYQFWKTDGTAAGTEHLDTPALEGSFRGTNGVLLAYTEDAQLITTDGAEHLVHDLDLPVLDSACAFAYDDVVVYQELGNATTGLPSIKRSNGGTITTLSDGFSDTFQVFGDNGFVSGDTCYMTVLDTGGIEILVIPQTGDAFNLSDRLDISDNSGIFAFKNRLYAVRNLGSLEYAISRFNPDLNDYDATYLLPAGFSTSQPQLSSDYIMVTSSTPTVSPPIRDLTYLDIDLNEVNDLGGFNQRAPTFHPTAQGDLFVGTTTDQGISAFTLSYSPNLSDDPIIDVINQTVHWVVTAADSEEIYLMLHDRVTAQHSLHRVADVPNINASTAGVWHDPSVANQGLVLNQGRRSDGSLYLFVSVYTMIDGLPRWLAGVADFNPPQASIDVELLQYQGGTFFQPNTNTESSAWGQANITMTACNQLQASLTATDQSTLLLDLVRIDNRLFDLTCSD